MKYNSACRSCFLILVLLFSSSVYSQSYYRNLVFAELGSNSLFTSLNYERQLLNKPKLALRGGIGIYGVKPSVITFPVGVNYLLRIRNSELFIDAGFGATYTKTKVELYAIVEDRNNFIQKSYWNYISSIGLRKLKDHLMWRINFSLVANETIGVLPFAGIAVGRTF